MPKTDFILPLCEGRSVLDLGCLNHTAERALAGGTDWLHARVAGVARELVGGDLPSDDLELLAAKGFRIVGLDAQDFDLERTFDVVLAADIIEHLDNVGLFLASVTRHLRDDSRLVLTTNNPFDFAQTMQVLINGRPVVNPEHTAWFDPSVLFELLDRNGFRVEDFAWLDSDPDYRPSTVKTRILHHVAAVVAAVRPMNRTNYGVVATLHDKPRQSGRRWHLT